MNEPGLKVEQTGKQGRPAYTEEQYKIWLDELEPFLKLGNTLYYCCERAGITPHYVSILNKYKMSDWFSLKVDAYRLNPGELVNNTLVKMVVRISDRFKQDLPLSDEDFKVLKLMAEKHRTAQPFFVTRTEEAPADDSKLGKIIDNLDQGSDYEDLAREAEKQVVETNPPVQDQGQAGANASIQAQHDPASIPSGTPESPTQ